MKTFSITFNGRKKNSIGVMQVFNVTVNAEDIAGAVSSLYETYEHIRVVTHTEVAQ